MSGVSLILSDFSSSKQYLGDFMALVVGILGVTGRLKAVPEAAGT